MYVLVLLKISSTKLNLLGQIYISFYEQLNVPVSNIIMGRKCCVMNCNGNYDSKNKEKTFRLPVDVSEKARWLSVIPRDNIPNSKHTVVCERHWTADYRKKNVRGKLRPVDPPSVFECVKFSQRPTAPPPPRRTKKALSASRQMEIDQLNIFDQMDSISSCKELIDGLPKKIESMNCFSIGRTETSAYIQSFEYVPSTGIPKFSLVIENDFTYEAFHHGVKCNIEQIQIQYSIG